ncbi:hypothetical protein MUK42_28978 [Musa troglodytarum]|uniref:Uncharacterized protein n=1 Tax=Musa troglodytarum TaxID=320322 RepID=A0A9E7GBJ3_9LILI|nr:hypothetical protein MUK42_28978 [Musa troglodytarum]
MNKNGDRGPTKMELEAKQSLPLSVLPTPSSTEKGIIDGPFPEALATISCGGSISYSSPSPHVDRRRLLVDLPGGHRQRVAGIIRAEATGDASAEGGDGATAAFRWTNGCSFSSSSERAARMPELRREMRHDPAPGRTEREWLGFRVPTTAGRTGLVEPSRIGQSRRRRPHGARPRPGRRAGEVRRRGRGSAECLHHPRPPASAARLWLPSVALLLRSTTIIRRDETKRHGRRRRLNAGGNGIIRRVTEAEATDAGPPRYTFYHKATNGDDLVRIERSPTHLSVPDQRSFPMHDTDTTASSPYVTGEVRVRGAHTAQIVYPQPRRREEDVPHPIPVHGLHMQSAASCRNANQ